MDIILKHQLKKKKTVDAALKFCRAHQSYCLRNISYVNSYINAIHGIKREIRGGGLLWGNGKRRKESLL